MMSNAKDCSALESALEYSLALGNIVSGVGSNAKDCSALESALEFSLALGSSSPALELLSPALDTGVGFDLRRWA